MAEVYWIGGSPCSGKSSVAQTLAARHGLHVYSCDAAFERHMRAADPAQQPTLARLAAMSPDQIWLEPVAEQVQRVRAIYHEEFTLIQADLAGFDGPVIVEGAALMPGLVAPLLHTPTDAVWMIPTVPFQQAHYAQRPWAADVVGVTSDPARAWANWMARDAAFARIVIGQAVARDLPCLLVDGQHSLAQNVERVAGLLGLAVQDGAGLTL